MMQNLSKSTFLLVSLVLASILLAACSSTKQFCEIARTSTQSRNQEEVIKYYQDLLAAAPKGIEADVDTLYRGWRTVSFPLGGGSATRPPEVTEAAKNVVEYVKEKCDHDGGIYLAFPEIGY